MLNILNRAFRIYTKRECLYINLKFRMLVNVPFQNWSLLIITKLHNTEKGSGEDDVYGLFLMRVFPDIHS